MIIKKSLSTEKSHKNQDKGIWTFLVRRDATKPEIKKGVEDLFGVTIQKVHTSMVQEKRRQLRGSRIHTRRHPIKMARIKLKKESKKLDLTKFQK